MSMGKRSYMASAQRSSFATLAFLGAAIFFAGSPPLAGAITQAKSSASISSDEGGLERVRHYRQTAGGAAYDARALHRGATSRVDPELPKCVSHVRELVRRLGRHYTEVQLENALVSFCITSQEFGTEDGFSSRKQCEKHAKKLVEARNAEAAGEDGAYVDFCQSYHSSKDASPSSAGKQSDENAIGGGGEKRFEKMEVGDEDSSSKKVTEVSGDSASKKVKEASPSRKVEDVDAEPVAKKGASTSTWRLVGAAILFALCAAACCYCGGFLGGATAKKEQPEVAEVAAAGNPGDWLRAIGDATDREAWVRHAEELFEWYDQDKSGQLEKEEFKELLEALATHITRQYDQMYGSSVTYSKTEISDRIKWELDSDFDGNISKKEFMTNLKKVLDDVK